MNTLKNLFKNLFHTFTSECPMTRNLFALIVTLFSFIFATPAFATEKWEAGAGQFKCGSASQYDAGATTIPQAVSQAVAGWDACVAEYGDNNCSVMAKGYTVGPAICDYTRNHDPIDGALGDARAEAIFRAFNEQRPAAMAHRLPNQVMVDSAYKAAYLVIKPIPGATRVSHTCNNGRDDDGDGKVDMADPGCSSPEDNDEFNADPISSDPDVRWKDLVPVILKEAATPCPVSITGWWEIDPQDRQYHFHYNVDYGDCPMECRTSDVSERPGYQMMSPKGIATAAVTQTVPVATAGATGQLKWSELRTHIEAPERAPGIEYVDSTGADDSSMWFGRAAEITDRGDLIIVSFKSVCEDLILAELEQEYRGVDVVVLGSGMAQASVKGDGSSISTHPWGTVAGEFGLEAGNGHSAYIGTIGVGGSFDDNCDMPSTWMLQTRQGAVFNRMGVVGLLVDVRVQYTFGPSWAITPDDATTTDVNEYAVSPALGTNSLAFPIDIGPRFAFGRGVHHGWIAPTFTAGPKLRWLPDTTDQNLRHPTVTGDVGGTLNVGWTW